MLKPTAACKHTLCYKVGGDLYQRESFHETYPFASCKSHPVLTVFVFSVFLLGGGQAFINQYGFSLKIVLKSK